MTLTGLPAKSNIRKILIQSTTNQYTSTSTQEQFNETYDEHRPENTQSIKNSLK